MEAADSFEQQRNNALSMLQERGFPSRHNFEPFGICAEAAVKIADRKSAEKDAKPMQGIA
jgi:hypothetical protein